MPQQVRLPIADSGAGWNDWTALGGGAHYLELDDPVGAPDDDASYIYTPTSDLYERFSYTAFALPAGITVTSIEVVVRAKLTAGTGNVRPFCYVAGSLRVPSILAVAAAYADYTTTFATNPDTGLAWTQADVEGTGPSPLANLVGFISHDLAGGGAMRATQLRIIANYTAPVTGSVVGADVHRRRVR